MSSVVQLNRLRSQINAIANHFEKDEEFTDALRALLEFYSDQEPSAKQWLRQPSPIQRMNIPASVMRVVISRLQLLAKNKPESAINNADILWASNLYELMSIAISLLSAVGSIHQEQVIERISSWIQPQLDQDLMHEIFSSFEVNPGFLLNKKWVNTLSDWLSTDNDGLKRIGLVALRHSILSDYEDLPHIFRILTPVFQLPSLPIQKELLEVTKTLIQRSEAETASFLIMMGTLNPQANRMAFIRKCLPFFDPYFESEIRKSLG